jgi:hypothetical protein
MRGLRNWLRQPYVPGTVDVGLLLTVIIGGIIIARFA